MAIDCEQLSPNAQKIFEKLKPYYPPDPWDKPQWFPEGIVHEIGSPRYDLRKSADRQKLIDWVLHMLGVIVETDASIYAKKRHGSLKGFTRTHFSRMLQHEAEFLLILRDLDFQIETMDLVEG
jgi:hypothetical protein